MRLPELNHEVLGGLLILRCFCNQGKDQMLTTSRVKRKAEKKKLKILEITGPKSFGTNKSTKFVKTTIYTELFTRRGHPGKEDINKNKESSFNLYPKRSIVFYYRSWSTKVKHRHQEKKHQY